MVVVDVAAVVVVVDVVAEVVRSSSRSGDFSWAGVTGNGAMSEEGSAAVGGVGREKGIFCGRSISDGNISGLYLRVLCSTS